MIRPTLVAYYHWHCSAFHMLRPRVSVSILNDCGSCNLRPGTAAPEHWYIVCKKEEKKKVMMKMMVMMMTAT
jgi:hypothetical protein